MAPDAHSVLLCITCLSQLRLCHLDRAWWEQAMPLIPQASRQSRLLLSGYVLYCSNSGLRRAKIFPPSEWILQEPTTLTYRVDMRFPH